MARNGEAQRCPGEKVGRGTKNVLASSSPATTGFMGKRGQGHSSEHSLFRGWAGTALNLPHFSPPAASEPGRGCVLSRGRAGGLRTAPLPQPQICWRFPFLKDISISYSSIPPPSPVITAFHPLKWDKWLDADFVLICCP